MPKHENQLTNKEKAQLADLGGIPDSEIDTSDIPEDTDWSKGERGKFVIHGEPRIELENDAADSATQNSNVEQRSL